MFLSVKSIKREDLVFVVEEIGEEIPPTARICDLKNIILNSNEYKSDPDFVKGFLENVVTERKLQEDFELERLKQDREERKLQQEAERKLQQDREERKLQQEAEERKLQQEAEERKLQQEAEERKLQQDRELELEKIRLNNELELARIQAQAQNQSEIYHQIPENSGAKKKFTLPKLQFRQFGDDLKDWLPFWSQFEHIDKDDDIEPENKFQYLVQATVIGSRAREVVESFPPTRENYPKAVQSLKARFGKEDILVEVYVRELLKLIISVQSNQKLSPTSLYDKLESYLRALETLGVTTDKCASILYPMVESCFDEEFLKAWNRNAASNSAKDAKERLENLMLFLKGEVEGEERISLAMSGFGLTKSEDVKLLKKKKYNFEGARGKTPTASMLFTSTKVPETNKTRCIFCDGKHASPNCFTAQKLSMEEKQKIVRDKKCCFACLMPDHAVRKCRTFLKCLICSRKHVPLMCDKLQTFNKPYQKKGEEENSPGSDVNLSNVNPNPKVFLQTFKAKLLSGDKAKTVRVLCDTGSQKSYILKNIAEEMKYPISRQETINHSLFGGVSTKECKHNCYKLRLKKINGNFTCNFEVLDQDVICDNVLPVSKGPWLNELKDLGIVLTDTNVCYESIQVLIGADILGKLLTGKREILSSGLVAVETHLGWTLMGKVPQLGTETANLAMTVTSLFVKEAEISDLWSLDVIGIRDPLEKKSKLELDLKAKEHFKETVKFNQDNRYEVSLPWADDSSPLPDNFNLAKKRLEITTEKLLSRNLYGKYEKVFQEWLDERIIEEVPSNEVASYGNYLPHRPVIKLSSSTTPIRPVFDASARCQGHPSLNQCLQCGPNLIELIPDILVRFREKKFGVTADIRKAFLQISVSKEERDFLRFLWWENFEEKKFKVFRHARVVFGVKSSPFLLGSVIEHHIETSKDFDCDFKKKLQRSFYVDNVVTSCDSYKDLNDFISTSSQLMLQGGFELRDWEHTEYQTEHGWETPVLGLKWDRQSDSLNINMSWITEECLEKITKRVMLSAAHKVFDPIGFTTPVMLCPKLMLQKSWKMNIGWDTEITGNLRDEFLQWFRELKILETIHIPRWISATAENLENCTIHTFCDASKDAYAAVVFLRLEEEGAVKLSLLAAKSRITPLRGGTIPRMELLAALIGARLSNSVVEALNWKEVKCYYWSDSTTVLAWISREENWSIFVRNRVQEIRKLTSSLAWNHIAGEMNPADLPSRGCSAKQFLKSKWWEGPTWLKSCPDYWPNLDTAPDEILVLSERKKGIPMSVNVNTDLERWYKHFSKFSKIVRVLAWIRRFINNIRKRIIVKEKTLTSLEIQEAQDSLCLLVQRESFHESGDCVKGLKIIRDQKGLIRVNTKIIERDDGFSFRYPILLPSKHYVVECLVMQWHVNNSHAGINMLMSALREQFWIISSRRVIRSVLNKCVRCKRFTSKAPTTPPIHLPADRVRDASAFEITGIDLCGPLILRNRTKAWIVLFTCGVYRAVHLELTTSLSTEGFIEALRRFIARRGRPSVIYSDNGTNFVGTAAALKKVNWEKISSHELLNKIKWKFIPPTAAWWGGWWERLIRTTKNLLIRVLGHSSVSYEELLTILCDIEAVINNRPLTYVSNDSADLTPLTPSMFIQEVREIGVPDLDHINHEKLQLRQAYCQRLRDQLRSRFRKEYLGQLVLKAAEAKSDLQVGDVVLVGQDNQKRQRWPMARIEKLFPGRDGNSRVARVKTQDGILLRPLQRLYPLEVSTREDHPVLRNQQPKRSRAGRMLKPTEKLNL